MKEQTDQAPATEEPTPTKPEKLPEMSEGPNVCPVTRVYRPARYPTLGGNIRRDN